MLNSLAYLVCKDKESFASGYTGRKETEMAKAVKITWNMAKIIFILLIVYGCTVSSEFGSAFKGLLFGLELTGAPIAFIMSLFSYDRRFTVGNILTGAIVNSILMGIPASVYTVASSAFSIVKTASC